MASLILTIILIVITTIIGSFGSLFLKKGSANFHLHFHKGLGIIIDIIKNYFIIIGIILYLISAMFFLYLLRTEELSMLYPMTSLSYVFVTILSYYILKEKINFYKTLGIVSIIFGVVLVTL
jgi:drug/metabolite transporter (DMT)-like permease